MPTTPNAKKQSEKTTPPVEAAENQELRAATTNIAEWVATLSDEETEKFSALHGKHSQSLVPTTAALLEFFDIDPNRVPGNNAFYTNGYITFRRRVEGDEMTVTGYTDDIPVLNQYPEGLTYELVTSAHKYDTWKLS